MRWIATYGEQQSYGSGTLVLATSAPAYGTTTYTNTANAWQDSTGYRVEVRTDATTVGNEANRHVGVAIRLEDPGLGELGGVGCVHISAFCKKDLSAAFLSLESHFPRSRSRSFCSITSCWWSGIRL